MGYRWHQGRLLTDEEYWSTYQDPVGFVIEVVNFIGFIGAMFFPTIALAILGYLITTSGVGILVGIVFGIILSIIINKILQAIFRVIGWLLIIGLIVMVIGFIIYAILQI